MNFNQQAALQDLIEYAKNATLEEDPLPPCIEVLEAYLDSEPVHLFMAVCKVQPGCSDYIVVAARTEAEAIQIVADDNADRENIEVLDGGFLENLYEQYGGVAVLSTGMGDGLL